MRAGRLGRGEERLACQCGAQECPVAAERKALADVVIHVLAEQATLDGTSDQPGYLAGFGVLPAESVRGLAATAQLKPLVIPSGAPDPGYRPSAVTAAFVRWRDLTCRCPVAMHPWSAAISTTRCPIRSASPTRRTTSCIAAPTVDTGYLTSDQRPPGS
jgi:Domain of unknown function (DUF222)